MILLPAIDLFGGQAVRLYQGDYNQMTVYDLSLIHISSISLNPTSSRKR